MSVNVKRTEDVVGTSGMQRRFEIAARNAGFILGPAPSGAVWLGQNRPCGQLPSDLTRPVLSPVCVYRVGMEREIEMGWVLIVMTVAAGQIAETATSLQWCRFRFHSVYETQTIKEVYCKSTAGDVVQLYPPVYQ